MKLLVSEGSVGLSSSTVVRLSFSLALLACLAAWPSSSATKVTTNSGTSSYMVPTAHTAPASPLIPTVYEVDRNDDNASATACTVLPNDCSLRGAIITSNANVGADTIIFSASTNGTPFTLTAGPADNEFAGTGATQATGDLDILDHLTITGNGSANTLIDGNDLDRIIDVNNFNGINSGTRRALTVVIEEVTLQNGDAKSVQVDPGPPAQFFNHSGGAIRFDGTQAASTLRGTLTVRNSVVTANTAALQGGGMQVINASLTVANCQVTNNDATLSAGGGILYSGGTSVGLRALSITNSTISGNDAPAATIGSGGGISVAGAATMSIEGNTIANNTAGANGGGISGVVSAATTKNYRKNKFTGNSATQGGSVFNSNGALTFEFNLVVGNNTGALASGSFHHVAGAASLNNNWWGCNEGPADSTSMCDKTVGTTSMSFLKLSHAATPDTIAPNTSTSLQADFYTNSLGGAVLPTDLGVLEGRAITFNNAVLGTISGADTQISLGKANATYTAGPVGGNGSADATVDHATVTANISIEQAPEIVCPDDITTGTDEGLCSATVSFSATATGAPAPTVTYKIGATVITSPHTFPTGSTTVTAEASNGVGDPATCSFTVTVTDDEPPSITCPSNITTDSDAGSCGAVVTYTAPTGTDNCPGATTTQTAGLPSGSTFPVGTTTNTFEVTDASGQKTSCSFTVTVEDNENPVVTVPDDIVVDTAPGTCAAVVNFTPTATDNCSGVTVVSSPASGSTFQKGTTTVTVTATDASGNQDVDTFDVTVNDNEAPAISCPADITTNVDPGSCGAVVTYTAPVGTDNCAGATTTQTAGLPSGSTFPVGTTTNTFKVTDASGHETSCSFTVTVVDNEPPAISCPANITTNADPESCSAVVNYPTPVGTDNCPGATTTQTAGLPSGSAFPVGTTINTFTVTAASGAQTSCSFSVTVIDNQAPTITMNGQTPVLWPPGHQYETINVTDLVASASDLCDAGVDINDVVIAEVSSDELEDGPADGSTLNDIVIAADCKTVQLRAERQASGNGRVYTIKFKVTDSSGNTTYTTGQVIVPKAGAGGGAILGPGPGYTVTSACP